jgi:hypothetical protein
MVLGVIIVLWPTWTDSIARRYAVLRPHLTLFQRRLWLGAKAAELGSGGIAIVAEATGVTADTVRRGRAEADDGIDPGAGRSRRPGGGRKRAEDFDEGLAESLIDPVTTGDPMSPLRWTSKSIRALTRASRGLGHQVSASVVNRLLRERGYSMQANTKTMEGNQHPDRDAPFHYLNDQAADHLGAGIRSSASAPRRKSWSGTSRTTVGSGIRRRIRRRYGSTTSLTMTSERSTRTGLTTWEPTPDGCRWASTTTSPRSRSTP